MLGKTHCEMLVREVLQLAQGADEAEVSVFGGQTGLTRFAENYIHQNVFKRNAEVSLRVVIGKRCGFGSTNRLDREGLAEMVERAIKIARLSEEDPDFGGLPTPSPVETVDVFRPSTERFTPRRRAERVASVINGAKAKGLRASGAFETGVREFALGNSKGIAHYYPVTVANFSTVVMSDNSSGYAQSAALDVFDLDVESLGREAIEKAERSRNPVALEAGTYPVVLAEDAVATMVSMLGSLGFNGLAFREGRTFLNEFQGKPVAHPMVSIWDDGLDPKGLPKPFDFEGVPKKRVELITRGLAGSPVYDSYQARLANTINTGHALPAPNTYGPLPLNVFMAPGTTPRTDLVKGIKKGIWVTRFHYTNPLHPLKTLITGMTRDGTFLIENGRITKGIKNLRFTNSILGALEKVEALSRETRTIMGSWSTISVPAARIGEFTFSGVTEF